MALTDQQVLSEIQAHLIEPEDNGVTWPSGLWTSTEVLDLLIARQRPLLLHPAVLPAPGPTTGGHPVPHARTPTAGSAPARGGAVQAAGRSRHRFTADEAVAFRHVQHGTLRRREDQ